MLPLDIQEIKPIKVTNEGVYFIGEEFKKQIDKKKLSPSMINAINQSPGEWALSAFVEPLVRIEEPIYFARGHWFHSIMEEHFKNPNRSIETLKEDFRNVTIGKPAFSDLPKDDEKKYLKMSKDIENKKWMTDCINGYIKLNETEDLESKKVAFIYDKGQRKDGIMLLLVVDCNSTRTKGADMVDLTEIMYNYGAVNAANLDGGTSSVFVLPKKKALKYTDTCEGNYCYINDPINASLKHKTRAIATTIIVAE